MTPTLTVAGSEPIPIDLESHRQQIRRSTGKIFLHTRIRMRIRVRISMRMSIRIRICIRRYINTYTSTNAYYIILCIRL